MSHRFQDEKIKREAREETARIFAIGEDSKGSTSLEGLTATISKPCNQEKESNGPEQLPLSTKKSNGENDAVQAPMNVIGLMKAASNAEGRLKRQADEDTARIIGASNEEAAKIIADAAAKQKEIQNRHFLSMAYANSTMSNLQNYASLRSLNGRSLQDLQKKMDCLNSPTIHAASALLSAATPPKLNLGGVEPPLVHPPRYGAASMTVRHIGPEERKRVPHVYHDYGQVPDNQNFTRKKTGGVTQPFPEKLMRMLNHESGPIVEWLPHGRAFIVRKPDEFTSNIMPKYFRQTKITSFQRQLNLYGFRRITQGADSGAYYHELFLRGRPNLCVQMVRTKVKGTGHKQPSDVTSEPNFYAMPAQPKIDLSVPAVPPQVQTAVSSIISNNKPPFSPHLQGAATLLNSIANGCMPDLSLGAREKNPQKRKQDQMPTTVSTTKQKVCADSPSEVKIDNNDFVKDNDATNKNVIDDEIVRHAPSPLPGDAGAEETNRTATIKSCKV